ncbi:translationally-controlled tumor protein homolog isoform X2 [Sebastes umbrosus]|nr:translationally-controlled tumor protein homolog isoform X2 [Sebastes umbrosus]
MIIYKCIICDDEMFSDTFKVTVSKSGIFYEVEGKAVTRTEGFDEKLISANASADEMTEGTDSTSVSGVDIVLNHKLQETFYNKKAYLTHMRTYVKAVKAKLQETNPDRVDAFVVDVQKEVGDIVKNMSKYQFFTGESMDPDGMVGLLNYREDEITPYMLFFKDGLLIEKC